MSFATLDGRQAPIPSRKPTRLSTGDIRSLMAAFLYDQGFPPDRAAEALGINERAYWYRLNRAARLRARARLAARAGEGDDLG